MSRFIFWFWTYTGAVFVFGLCFSLDMTKRSLGMALSWVDVLATLSALTAAINSGRYLLKAGADNAVRAEQRCKSECGQRPNQCGKEEGVVVSVKG